MSVAHRLTKRSVLPPPVQTWTDLDCGCSRADNGSWIVTTGCELHERLVPPNIRDNLPLHRKDHLVGPFRPVNG